MRQRLALWLDKTGLWWHKLSFMIRRMRFPTARAFLFLWMKRMSHILSCVFQRCFSKTISITWRYRFVTARLTHKMNSVLPIVSGSELVCGFPVTRYPITSRKTHPTWTPSDLNIPVEWFCRPGNYKPSFLSNSWVEVIYLAKSSG